MHRKYYRWIWGAAVLLCAAACHNTEDKEAMLDKPYFDIEHFFLQQADSLQKAQPYILKQVRQGAGREDKEMQIDNWRNELDFFISSDINKPDWLGSFRTDTAHNEISYVTQNPKIRTKLIKISYDNGAIAHIHIQNSDSNSLYRSVEQLDYYPDSLYSINKKQHVRLLGKKEYEVTGSFKKN